MKLQLSTWSLSITLLFVYAASCSQVMAAKVVSEKITFLNEDGRQYVRYDTTRTQQQSYDIWFNKSRQKRSLEHHLDNYLYLYPNEYRWDSHSQPQYDLMKIASGSFASLINGEFDENTEVRIDEDGVYTFTNWDGKSRTQDQHYGVWNKPDDFSQLIYSWVFPSNLHVISYTANRPGKWVKRNNTVTYYGNNVNDLVFTIKYQPDTNAMYHKLLSDIATPSAAYDDITLKQSVTGVRITLMTKVLFASGSTELSKQGQDILQQLARTLSPRDDLKFIIEGHTDNVAIKGELSKLYKTNWELSSARALKVLHFLVAEGVAESSLEARAHAANIPVDNNTNQSGKAQNRRIEILLEKKKSNG